MDTSSKLVDAIVVALETFSKGFDLIAETHAKVSAERTKAINFVVDTAKAEGLASSDIVKVIDGEVFIPAVESKVIGKLTRYQYRSGLIKSLAHGVAWYPRAFELEAVQESGKKAKGRPKAKAKAVTVGTVKVDRKARAVEIKLGKSTDIDAFTKAITAVQSEPARVALFLAYCKAQGWTE